MSVIFVAICWAISYIFSLFCQTVLGMHDIIRPISESADDGFNCTYGHQSDMKKYADTGL